MYTFFWFFSETPLVCLSSLTQTVKRVCKFPNSSILIKYNPIYVNTPTRNPCRRFNLLPMLPVSTPNLPSPGGRDQREGGSPNIFRLFFEQKQPYANPPLNSNHIICYGFLI